MGVHLSVNGFSLKQNIVFNQNVKIITKEKDNMNNIKNMMCFFHFDLDGVVSYLTTRWAFPNVKIDFVPVRSGWFYHEYLNYFKKQPKKYDWIYILDLDISKNYGVLNGNNIFIIDHHKSHVLNLPRSRSPNIKICVKEFTSAAKLSYKLYNRLYDLNLTKEQKTLIALADDYDSYKLRVPQSSQLNNVFWNSAENGMEKIYNFINWFKDGFTEFTSEQKDILQRYQEKHKNIIKNLEIWEGVIRVAHKERKVMSTFATEDINGVADYILKEKNPDIVFVVNLNTNRISLRKNPECPVDLSILAGSLCSGAGHEYSAGGSITDEFLMFTKLLTKIK